MGRKLDHSRRRHHRPLHEPLEGRQLLAAPVARLDAGILTILGTPDRDQIFVERRAAGDRVAVRSGLNSIGEFNLADVTRIRISGLEGDDRLGVDNRLTIDAAIDGGPGDDEIHGGGGSDRLDGGPGADELSGRRRGDTFVLIAGQGTDRVIDFQDGSDRVELGGGLNWAELAARQDDDDTVLGVSRPTLVGFASLPARTFGEGPTSGQFITGANGVTVPFDDQPVQGFSAVRRNADGTYWVMSDNGYGAKNNSADFLLRLHRIAPDFRTVEGGAGGVTVLESVTLRDPDRKVPFPIVADLINYPNGAGNIPVDPTIKGGRLLTGSDFDIESFRVLPDGTIYFGDEFGPFLLHTDATGKVLEAPIRLPDFSTADPSDFVNSPDSPFLGSGAANLPRSRGFEGMAINTSGTKLYPSIEGALTTDPDQRRRIIYEFDLAAKRYTGTTFQYRMEDPGHAIGDLTAVNDREFLIIERDNNQGAAAQFKKIFLINFDQVGSDGFLVKREVVDLLNIADPNGLGAGTTDGRFTFPFQTIEDVEILDAQTIGVLDDNNFPFSAGRTPGQPDNNEFILISLAEPLNVAGDLGRPTRVGTSSLILEDAFVEDITIDDTVSTAPRPLVIGHRGFSGRRPEHTLASYRLAAEGGADFIEPDLELTKDGVLIARHEPVLATVRVDANGQVLRNPDGSLQIVERTTDVDERPEFASRLTTRLLDGVPTTGWWAQDFTLAEIKQLRAVERLPALRKESSSYDGMFEIPTFEEVVQLSLQFNQTLGRPVGIYPETKHPTFHDSVFARAFGPNYMERELVRILDKYGLNRPDARVFIQSFEVGNLKYLNGIANVSLVQLFDQGSAKPYDFVVEGDPRTYGDLVRPAELAGIAEYAEGIGPWKRLIKETAADEDNDGVPNELNPLIRDAHAAGLLVHAYTFRDEPNYLLPEYGGDPANEYKEFFGLGLDGLFSDWPSTAREVADPLYPFTPPDFLGGVGLADRSFAGVRRVVIQGGAGDDILVSRSAPTTLTGRSGTDLFVVGPDNGPATITDFRGVEGERIGLAGGLTFAGLSILQGRGPDANTTLISRRDTGRLLAILNGVQATTVTAANFVRVGPDNRPLPLANPPKVVVISLDGATPSLIRQYLASGVLSPDRGLGLLASRGIFADRNVTISPSLTAPGHIAIATGSTAARNDIVGNSFHLVASPFATNISGFAAPIGGYEYEAGSIHGHEDADPTAEPLWIRLRAAGKKVVAATFPGADGIDIRVPGRADSPIVQPAGERTVDYTVPFGAFGGQGARGFSLTRADFGAAPAATTTQLAAAGKVSFSPVLQGAATLETFALGGVTYDIQVAAFDATDDRQVNYDTLVFFDAALGIQPGPFSLPSTGPAYLRASDRRSSLFYFEGSSTRAGAAFYVSNLAPDLSTVRFARYSANFIPRNAAVLGNVDDINANVGFWAPQPDFRIPERLSPGFEPFPEPELEAMYEDQVRSFVDYQVRVGLRGIEQVPGADLAMIYIEQPDGSEHQFLLTDPRQPTDFRDPNSIGAGQDPAKVARYRSYLEEAYRVADRAVQRIIEAVGTDASGEPRSNILVVSDHGIAPFHTAVNLNSYLASRGFDTSKVRAVTSGPAANVYINLHGREPNGTVGRAEYLTLQQQVIAALRDLMDANPNYTAGAASVPVFDEVYARPVPADLNDPSFGLGTGEFIGQDSGDVYALLTLGYNFDGTQTPVVRRLEDDPSAPNPVLSVPNFYGAHGYDPTLPEMSAIFLAAGPDIGRGTLAQVRNIDVAPTILRLLGVQPAPTVQGIPIELGGTATAAAGVRPAITASGPAGPAASGPGEGHAAAGIRAETLPLAPIAKAFEVPALGEVGIGNITDTTSPIREMTSSAGLASRGSGLPITPASPAAVRDGLEIGSGGEVTLPRRRGGPRGHRASNLQRRRHPARSLRHPDGRLALTLKLAARRRFLSGEGRGSM